MGLKSFIKKIAGSIKESEVLIEKPNLLIFDITHRCNINCNICDIRKDKQINEFTAKEIIGIVSQAIKWGVPSFVLSGGEPLLRKDVFEVLSFCKENKYPIGILTNGTLLDKAMLQRLKPYLISGCLSLTVSLDAVSPSIHDKIRGHKGAFKKTVAALKSLAKMKKRYPCINYGTISIILNDNLEEIPELMRFLKGLNPSSIQLQPLLNNNLRLNRRNTKNPFWIGKDRLYVLDETIDEAIRFKKENPKLLSNSVENLMLIKKYFRNELSGNEVSCSAAKKTMLISREGYVVACDTSYGNIRKSNLKDIWNSREAENARRYVCRCKNPCLLPCFTDM